MQSIENCDRLFRNLKKTIADKEPFFFDVIQLKEIRLSKIYDLPHCKNQRYRGVIAKLPSKNGFRIMYFIQVTQHSYFKLFQQGIYLILLDAAGIGLLFAVSCLYIKKVLTPLQVARDRQNEFIASVSHELRSPLTVIKTGIHSIKAELSQPQLQKDNITKARHYIFPIESECIRMNRLIDDMLLLSATEQGQWTIIKKRIDLETLLIEVYDTFCILHSDDTRRIKIDLSGEPLQHVLGDYERLKQICMILLDNAISYTPSDKEITIRAYNGEADVYIEVEDHGDGMSDEEKHRVFDTFYRRERARNDKNHFGLGLSIAKKLINLHNGSISITNTKGGGTTFRICLHAA